jgi:putative Holliday junction resolvase
VTGTWVGVDVGTVRVGVARSDPGGVLATPLATLARDARADRDLDELAGLVRDLGAVGVVVGLPRTLRGREGQSAEMARNYAQRLAERIAPIPVHHVDERLTTVSAQRKLHQNGVRGSRKVRAIIDQVAAVELLQQWLDTPRRGG